MGGGTEGSWRRDSKEDGQEVGGRGRKERTRGKGQEK